jgi:hypothetical protein
MTSNRHTDTDSEEAVNFAQRAGDSDLKYFPLTISSGPFVTGSRIPSAAKKGVRSGPRAAAGKGSTLSGELGRLVQ